MSVDPTLVLVIDDDEGIRTSLGLLLQAKGFLVISASDGAAGLLQFERYSPQIVITDMIMPGHRGLDTIVTIRKSDPDVVIIAMSGSIEDGRANFLDQAHAAGADLCLSKPFELSDLLDALERTAKRTADS